MIMAATVLNWIRVGMADRTNAVTLAAAVIVPMSALFMARCLMWHREKRPPWDTATFALNLGGAFAAVWFIVEAILNVSDPPSSWRIYVIVLSLSLLHHSIKKAIDSWALSRKPPPKDTHDTSTTS